MTEERKTNTESETKSTTISTTVSTVLAKKEEAPHLMLADVVKTKAQSRAFKDLLGMFTTCRPHDTKSTLDFALRWIKPLGAKMDERGNWTLRIGESKVLWSSHIDTVDWREGPKNTVLNHATGVLRLSEKDSNASCLGADCTTGVWIMREMALAKVPGLYIWHEAEESGGQGSSHIAHKTPDLLKGIDAAIAFDRKDFDSIITEQSGGVCCSEEFSKALAKQLPDTGFKSDPTGTFTDTANYTDLVAECTNLSVGYFNQHFKGETQNVIFAMLMRAAMIRFDEKKLVIKRKPGTGKRVYSSFGYGGGYGSWDRFDDWGGYDSSSKYKAATPRDYVLTGDKVRILAGAVGHGALLTDVGREGIVKIVCYKTPKTVSVKFEGSDMIENLNALYVVRVPDPIPHRPRSQPLTTDQPSVFIYGDRVAILMAAKTELQMRGKDPLLYIGKQGKVTMAKGGDWINIYMDSGETIYGLKASHLRLASAQPPQKETRCGGLCENGVCQGICKNPELMSMLHRLKAKTPSAGEAAKERAKLAKERAKLAREEAEKAWFASREAQLKSTQPDPKVTFETRNGRRIKVIDCEGDGVADRQYKKIYAFINAYPEQVADLIEQWGLTVDDLYENFPDCL